MHNNVGGFNQFSEIDGAFVRLCHCGQTIDFPVSWL